MEIFEYESRYLNPLTDFGFHRIFGTESKKELLIDFLNQVIKEEELETHFEKWLYLLKNLPNLKNRPAAVDGKIFEELFELAEINRLTEEDMETYNKSILQYYDVRLAVDCARDEAREEGIKKGREEGIKEGIEKEKISIIQKCLQKNIAMEDIASLTGYSKEQITRFRMDQTLRPV